MKNNPFSLDFGAEPNLFIPRFAEYNKVIDTFSSETPSSHIFLITGARGTGKTVLMTSVSHELRKNKSWLHIDLNPEGDMLNSLAAQLIKESHHSFPKIKLDVSIKGVGLSYEKEDKYEDIQTDLDAMMLALEKHHVRVLITVDEITNAKNIREFTSYFQHCLREKLPVFLLMTGLFKNIRALQNNRSQTFLKRSPRIEIGPLNSMRISQKYKEVFNISDSDAADMAGLTMGYSYAFQILGYLTFDAGMTKPDNSILEEYRLNLFENSYDKIWEELSGEERRVLSSIAENYSDRSTKLIREKLNIDSNRFSTYQNVLVKSGLLSTKSAYGKVEISLPLFKDFVLTQG